jgi:DNA-binding response OmpR family regulator
MSNPSILIIEDDVPLLRLYSQILSVHNYVIAQAESMDQARSHLTTTTFDLLLADVQMGKERSTDLIRDMRNVLRESGTRVILMSAEEKYRSLRDELNLDLFVVKPVAPSALINLVDQYLPVD